MGTPLADLYDGGGPYVSLYLKRRGDTPVGKRWRVLRRQLAEDGVRGEMLRDIDREVDRLTAPALAAVVADPNRMLTRQLWLPVSEDQASVGALPNLLPLLAAEQHRRTHLLAVIGEETTKLVTVYATGRVTMVRALEGPLNGGIPELASSIARSATRTGADLVAVSRTDGNDAGSVASRIAQRLTPDLSIIALEEHVDSTPVAMSAAARAVAQRARDQSEKEVTGFLQVCDEGRAVVGDDVLPVLAAGRGRRVIIDEAHVRGASIWFDPRTGRAASDGQDLPDDIVKVRLADVAIRHAVLDRLPLVVVSDKVASLDKGVGVVLR